MGRHKVVPIKWDPAINAWALGNTEHVASLKVIEDSYILREGPSGFATPSEQEFYEKFNIAKYHVTPQLGDEQVDPGHDPVMVVEAITGHKGRGKKRKYRVKWKGSTKETYEPIHHLTGCEEILLEYKAKIEKQKQPVIVTGRKLRSTRHAGSAIQKNEDACAVEELIRKQKVKGTVKEWLPGYTAELNNIKAKRLQPITNAEEMKAAKKAAVPIRMNLEPKRDGRKKGRLIVQGFKELLQWMRGQTDSPVANLSTIRSLLFMGCDEDTILSAIDIVTAFIQSDKYESSEKPRYVSFKPHRNAAREYYKLTGPLYGQRDAPMRWYKTIQEWLLSEGFKQGKNDPCIFVKEGIRVVLWVDDILVRATPAKTKEFYANMKKRFDVKNPEYLTSKSPLSFLGFDIKEGEVKGKKVITMDQNTAINRFLDDWSVEYTKGVKCPMPSGKAMWQDGRRLSEADKAKYQQLVGGLSYFAMTTRYDIAHATSRLSQMAANPTIKGGSESAKKSIEILEGER